MTTDILDVAGLGIGPFNLSIAALLDEVPDLRAGFFEARPGFAWHPGMMLPGVRLQTSYLKDLVTGVSPTNPHSFLNYLVRHGRFYPFLVADLPAVSRREFADYLGWVASRLDTLRFDHRVTSVTYDDEAFVIGFAGDRAPVRSRNIVLGTGLQPKVPSCAEPWLSERFFHNHDIASRPLDVEDMRVAVVGGGQSGAEVVEAMLSGHWGRPAALDWFSRRPNFEPLDEVAFSNEYFTPGYVDVFHGIERDRKPAVVAGQKLASDGISPDTLRSLYRRLYEGKALGTIGHPVRLMPGRDLVGFEGCDVARLAFTNALSGGTEHHEADVVVFCTGFEHRFPDPLLPIMDELHLDDRQTFVLERDFRVRWDGPEHLGIYAVNAGRYSHGIAEPQMSLNCWRAATIVNSVARRDVFDLSQGMDMVCWTGRERPAEVKRSAVWHEEGTESPPASEARLPTRTV